MLQFLVSVRVSISPQAETSTGTESSSKYCRYFSRRRNSIGLLKVSIHQRHKGVQAMRLFVVRVIIRFLDPLVVMLFNFPSPIATQFSNAVLSATIDTVEVANDIRRSGRLGFSRVHTPPRWATCSDSS